jgi:sulfoxide reductase heme-binding subunit YedZ
VWGVALSPLTLLLYRTYTNDLGANPISYATNLLGDTTLRLLLASLSLTPLRLMFGISWQMSLRRLLGLFAFFYASLHFLVWIAVDHFFDWAQMTADIVKRPYITVGMLALTLLLPLASTSTARMVKRLGGTNWRRLHKLVYVVGVLGVLHYLWLAKKGVNDPYWYAVWLSVLLGIRSVDWARRVVKRRRQRMAAAIEGVTVTAQRAFIFFIFLSIGLLAWTVWPAGGQALRRGRPAPEIAGGPWINSPPLTMNGLRGRVVLVEFWTYG